MKRWPAAPLSAGVAVLALAGWAITERRAPSALYCIEKPGTLWNGAASLPTGMTPECPPSRSYREEVRKGESRVEQYRLEGWRPRALLETFKRAGYRQLTEDAFSDNYSAFLSRGSTVVQYVAMREGGTTLIGISGPP